MAYISNRFQILIDFNAEIHLVKGNGAKNNNGKIKCYHSRNLRTKAIFTDYSLKNVTFDVEKNKN